MRRSKRLASRVYQLKAGHCLTGQYPKRYLYSAQTMEHFFKNCPHRKTR